MHDDQLIEDLLRDPLDLGWYRIANAPIHYRAFELGEVRFGWTVPPLMRPVHAGPMLPSHFALTLRLSPQGHWRVESMKPFEWAGDAERWARALWRDAVARTRQAR